MKTPLLQTKLYIPSLRPGCVPRPHLIERLNEGLHHKLTLIAAPAGFGKTTLASSWIYECSSQRKMKRNLQPGEGGKIQNTHRALRHKSKIPKTQRAQREQFVVNQVAWLSLDKADNAPIHFWTYIIAALQTVQPRVGQTALAILQSPQMSSIENLITNLVNEITVLSDQIVLVLDDYHVIETLEIHQSLNFLLDHLPPQLHLVIITREDPPLPLARLRVRRQMTEIRANHLRFTLEETAQFINQTMGFNLQIEDIAALERRTEGWIAGLQLAALSMQDIPDTTTFIKAFAGNDRYIVDYLIAEVMQRQSPHVQEFLLQTALLNRFTAPLCNAVTNKENGRDILTYLEQANLFLIPLDNKREWYRYHHLFGDLLQYRLKEEADAQCIKQLHRRAAAWYAQNSFTGEAIHHALAAEDYLQAAELIEAVGISLIVQGRLRKMLDWIEALPDKLVLTRPLLCVCYAWVLNLMGQAATVELHLQKAERALSNADSVQRKDIQGLIHTIRAFLARRQGDIPGSMQHLRQASENLSPDNLMVRATVNLNLGFNYSLMGQLEQAQQALQAARADGQASDAVYVTLLAMAVQGNTYVAQGKLRSATELYQEAIDYGLTQNNGQPFPPAGYAYAGRGQVLYEQNDLDSAERHLTKAVELGELMAEWSMTRRGLLPLAWLKQMQGDSAAAQALWRRALNVVQQAESKRVEAQLEAHRARLWLVQARMSDNQSALALAADWAEKYQQNRPDISSYPEAFAQITLAWIELVQGEADQALTRLKVLAKAAIAGGQIDNLIRILALQALAQAAQNDLETALNTLSRALDLAAPEGYIRTFVDHGLPMQRLLQQALTGGITPDYVPKLLDAFPELRITISDLPEENQIVNTQRALRRKSKIKNQYESLNKRELSILRLMAAGLSNREIAEELYLSVNTIKWYTSHIYNKLDVKKRAEAVDRAHELGIL